MRKIQISLDTKSIIRFFTVALAMVMVMWLIYEVRFLVVSLVISAVITLGLLPIVDHFKAVGVPRGISVTALIAFIILVLVTIGIAIANAAVSQTIALGASIPKYISSLNTIPELTPYIGDIEGKIGEYLSGAPGAALSGTIGAFSGITLAVSLIALTAYLLIDFYKIRDFILKFLSKNTRKQVDVTLTQIENEVGYWLRAQLVLMIIVGSLTYIGLVLMGVEYALALALIAGLLEFIPFIGPIIATVPALIVGFSISPFHGLGVLILYIVIQQLENNLIVPKVMQRAVGFNPALTLIVVLVGNTLFGVLGAIMAVPFTLVVYIIIKRQLHLKNKTSSITE
jgi:predicted PurR-regulated permease PerM